MDNKLLLLGLLRRQHMHGYQLNEFIENNLALCADLKKPTAYYLLEQMQKEGWIDAVSEQEGNRPPRKVYRLTETGNAAFERLLVEGLSRYQAVNFPGDAALAFLDQLTAEQALPLLKQQRLLAEERLHTLQNIPAHPGSLALVFSHQIHHLQAELAWLDATLERLANP